MEVGSEAYHQNVRLLVNVRLIGETVERKGILKKEEKMRKTIFLITILIFFIIQCSPKSETKESNAINNEKRLVVKGLSVGLDFGKAREQVLKLFEDAGFTSEIETDIEADKTEIFVEDYLTIISIHIWKDKDNKLSKIEMSSDATNKFFNATNLNAEDFVKEFASNYSMPAMKPEKDEIVGYTYWKYESKEGWYIKINDAKYITIETIKPKFD